MRNVRVTIWVVVVILSVGDIASADTFGTGANQFTIDFVNISGDASSANGTYIGGGSGQSSYKTFTDPGDLRIGTYELTNDQWNKFTYIYGTPWGNLPNTYELYATWTATDLPTNRVSWFEAAQFINWLNTSTGHQAAYKFTGTRGTGNYTFSVWSSGDAGYDVSNPYRNSEAFYFLPTEDEWVKAAYWNGTSLQTWSTKDGLRPIAGLDANYDQPTPYMGPYAVGSYPEELNGTFDMMGNVREWNEGLYYSGDYGPIAGRIIAGGSYPMTGGGSFSLTDRDYFGPINELAHVGFRVASVPEPTTLFVLALGTVMLRRKRYFL